MTREELSVALDVPLANVEAVIKTNILIQVEPNFIHIKLDDSKRTELRDKFAMAALANGYCEHEPGNPDKIAEWAYQIADAMLAERDKERADDHL